eukprot:gnl/TRDRNA2_/TRDRNA2_84318_c0_seq2.p1 gnl/TRDRNA2_/TRDRNA2_84318_c0~~gnl/TRDRNA2_/TRDRNA2_84318_c0_seq2.p1  ORF type:complete len:223 (-),score=29.38 gnl/TRDRNA2_/TRDRNA2_84318_c0_seq2:144-812(-)
MAAMLFQQGSKGALRDLDYINPRPQKVSCALPPEVRRKLGLDAAGAGVRSSSVPPDVDSLKDLYTGYKNADAKDLDSFKDLYTGSKNADAKVGKSGAGTNWHNPNGHAFIRRGSGVPMSQRASRQAQLSGESSAMIAQQSAESGRAPGCGSAPRPPPMPNGSRLTALESDLPAAAHGRPGSGSRARSGSASRERANVALKDGAQPPRLLKVLPRTRSLPSDR